MKFWLTKIKNRFGKYIFPCILENDNYSKNCYINEAILELINKKSKKKIRALWSNWL